MKDFQWEFFESIDQLSYHISNILMWLQYERVCLFHCEFGSDISPAYIVQELVFVFSLLPLCTSRKSLGKVIDTGQREKYDEYVGWEEDAPVLVSIEKCLNFRYTS